MTALQALSTYPPAAAAAPHEPSGVLVRGSLSAHIALSAMAAERLADALKDESGPMTVVGAYGSGRCPSRRKP